MRLAIIAALSSGRRREREERRPVELLELHPREDVREEVEDEARLDAHLLAQEEEVLHLREVAAVHREEDLVHAELRGRRAGSPRASRGSGTPFDVVVSPGSMGFSRMRPRSLRPHHGWSRMSFAIAAAPGVSPTRTTVRKLKPRERTRRATRRTVTRSAIRKTRFTPKNARRKGREMKSQRRAEDDEREEDRAEERRPRDERDLVLDRLRAAAPVRAAEEEEARPDQDDRPDEDEVHVEVVEGREAAGEERNELAPQEIRHRQRREGDAEVGGVQEGRDRPGLLLQHQNPGEGSGGC